MLEVLGTNEVICRMVTSLRRFYNAPYGVHYRRVLRNTYTGTF